MDFITKYLELLSSHPLTTPVLSIGLLALTLHLMLPVLCEVWRYYPNKITGTDTVKNWYLEKIHGKVLWERWVVESKYPSLYSDYVFKSEKGALAFTEGFTYRSNHLRTPKHERYTSDWFTVFVCISILLVVSPFVTCLLEYLIANFFLYTLVAGLAVGLHFTVILLGKKLYSVSEDVKLLKKVAEVDTKKENT